jgi:hypothetical protein
MQKIVRFLNSTIKSIASPRAGFLFALLGTITQTTHTWFIALQFSSFTGAGAVLQAAVMSLFLSGGLLYYIVKTGQATAFADKMKYNKIANLFMALEIFINLFYWCQKIVFNPWLVENAYDTIVWHELTVAIPFSILIPVILKTYGGEINFNEVPTTSEIDALNGRLDSFIKDDHIIQIKEIDSDNKQYKITFNK